MGSPKTESFPNTESYALSVKKEELNKIKEELKKVKENATQSWLDSRPLIDELERQKSNLEVSKNRASMSSTLVPELEAELEKTYAEIKSKKEGELEATKTEREISQALDRLREEMESLKCFEGERRQKKLKMERVLRLRRKRLRSLQLIIEAVRKETEACAESREEAVRYLNVSEIMSMEKEGVDDQVLQLSHEEYMALKKRVDEENSLADWRVSVAAEQRIEAEKSRDLSKEKLREMKLGKRMRKLWEVREREEKVEDDIGRVVVEEEGEDIEVMAVIPVAEPKEVGFQLRPPAQVRRRARTTKKKKINRKQKKKTVKGKKRSIFSQMKHCFVFNIILRLFR